MKLLNLPVLAGALFASSVAANTCDAIKKSDADFSVKGLLWPRWYWSTACKALKPSCVLLPETTEDVVDIVNLLLDSDEPFAVKSGGHNPNEHFGSVEGGPLVSMERLNEVTLDEEAQTVRVGPGNRWQDVQSALDGTGYTVVGGRIGHVGVSGLLLGGGLSFLSAQHGWAANSVLEYDLVLPNGTAITASATSHPDLFLSLRGGGNNFGIVTSFLLRAHPQDHDVWGGSMIFKHTEERQGQLLAALRDFAEHCDDEKAALILVNVRAPEIFTDSWFLFTFYDGPEPPEEIFGNFTAAKPWSNTSRRKSYNKLLREGNSGVIRGTIYTIATETLPVPDTDNAPLVLNSIHNSWRNVSGVALKKTSGISTNMGYQPFTKAMARKARENGGDLLDIDDDVSRIILEYNYSHLWKAQHDGIQDATVESYEGAGDLISRFEEGGMLPKVYRPLFMNDAYSKQDFWGRMKPESRARAARTAAEVDPEALFQSRTGGFKP